jgi:hypothetical protein
MKKRLGTSDAACSGHGNRANLHGAGNSFATTGFLPPPPHSPRRLPEFRWGERPREPRRPGFDNDCPGSKTRHPVFKTRRPGNKTFRPDLDNSCSDLEGRCPSLKSFRPGFVSRCPGGFRFCPDFQTVAPFLNAAAPICRTPRLFCNILPDSYLCRSRREEALINFRFPISDFRFCSLSLVTSAPTTLNPKPSPVLSDTLSHRMGEGRGEGCRFIFNHQPSTLN